MSLSDVRPFFRTRLDSLGYKEWQDGFAFDNIPQTLLDGSYHIESGTISGSPVNQRTQSLEYGIVVRVFFRGFRDPAGAIDSAISASETILADILSTSNRVGTDIKDVLVNSIVPTPLSGTNDNDVILEIDFSAIIICDYS